jgi:hypothetical protein
MRRRIEDLIGSRIDDAILQTLKNSHLFAAVDLAWDSSTITRRTIPLVLYAQRRIGIEACITALNSLGCKDEYVKNSPDKKQQYIELPKFSEVNVNIVRSVITRRVAAQSARFTNLYPFFRYETRGTGEADKLRADLTSQRQDIMADQYGYREAQIQWIRDMLLYPYCVVFPACVWDRESEWVSADDGTAPEFQLGEDGEPIIQSRIKRQGVPLVAPHPSRVIYDSAHPIHSINSDTGCEWFGFWDVVRYGQVADNADMFNRSELSFGEVSMNWMGSYSSYFSQYYTTVTAPQSDPTLASENDRKANIGRYSSSQRDAAVYLTHLYWKIKPNQWRMGRYPFPVWLHLVIANSRTVVAAEFMPDCPGFVFTHNTSAQRQNNLSMAHELLPWQDQLTNLFTQLLECARRDLFGIAVLNIDAFPTADENAQKVLKEFRAAFRSENFWTTISMLEVSIIKMKELGVDLDNVFKVIRQTPNTQINVLLNCISQVLAITERVMAMSPQEQAQLSPRETSATEIQVIAGTTENLYQMISDSIDAGRAALKRYLYNALLSCGEDEISLPVIARYRRKTAELAGFRVTDEEEMAPGTDRTHFVVTGSKAKLSAEYIFNSRDGSERSSNIQAAQTLVQMLGVLMQPAAMAMVTKGQLADVLNSIVRQSGAGADVLIEPPPGQDAMMVLPPQPQAPMAPQGPPVGVEQAQLPTQ